MASVPALTELTVADLWKEVKNEATVWGDISRETLRTVKLLLEDRMEDELAEYLKVRTYVRSRFRRGYRTGSYVRRLTTPWGTMPLNVPRARTHGFTPSVLPRYQRRTASVNSLVRSVFLGGVSTRQVGPLLAELLEAHISPTTVSAITRTLDHAVRGVSPSAPLRRLGLSLSRCREPPDPHARSHPPPRGPGRV